MSEGNVAEKLRELMARAGYKRESFARAAGRPRGQSYWHYLRPEAWGGKRYPIEFIAEIAPVLIGKGNPAITASEIWALAERKSGLTVLPSAVTTIPVLGWSMLAFETANIEDREASEFVGVAGLGAGKFVAARVPDHRCAQIAPPGSLLVIDTAERELRDGKYYALVVEDEAIVRLYRNNPERFESVAMPPVATLILSPPVKVIGRIVRIVTEL